MRRVISLIWIPLLVAACGQREAAPKPAPIPPPKATEAPPPAPTAPAALLTCGSGHDVYGGVACSSEKAAKYAAMEAAAGTRGLTKSCPACFWHIGDHILGLCSPDDFTMGDWAVLLFTAGGENYCYELPATTNVHDTTVHLSSSITPYSPTQVRVTFDGKDDESEGPFTCPVPNLSP